MTVLVAITGRDCSKLMTELAQLLPSTTISQWPECENLTKIEFVLAWNAPTGMWAQLPNLKAVSSFGAGVDSIDLSLLPAHVEVVRIVGTKLAEDMAEYVLTHVLANKLRLQEYFHKQKAKLWQAKRAYAHKHVCILGLGELGQACAQRLIANNFTVSGYSKTPKQLEEVNSVTTQTELYALLPSVDYLVCLLPLTTHTKGFINKQLLSYLPANSVIINVARGEHIIEEDLLCALEDGKLRGATLDVFASEPIGSEHPYWHHPQITITPHCAAFSDVSTVTGQVAENVNRLHSGLLLKNTVDRSKGY
ncbi:MAG: 2-hydroxyacid dehydrogenase [Pseudoalteromonas sp.]|uniref:2-hydroxyacid dehydrogenase n=1 Tax=unclassified Pseudoalteromonas TaxID=194690 RepID=UPI003F9BEC6A